MSTPFEAGVGAAELVWTPDLLPGYEQATLGGMAEDGPVSTVLVRRRCAVPTDRAVVYLHGFVDYFFQAHLGQAYCDAGIHFYALELRRHGRAMLPHQLPNFTTDLDEYLQDVDRALGALRTQEGVHRVVLNGHSTGGLVAALYAHRGRQRDVLSGIVLNSPFFDMNLPRWQQRVVEPVLAWVGGWWPELRLPGLPTAYGESLHQRHHGAWLYDTAWKPIAGFPVYAGWFRAIHRAHAELERGLNVDCPCLVLRAQRSLGRARWSEDVMSADVVLNVSDIERLAPKLGPRVQQQSIAGGIHDLMLSAPVPRQAAWQAVLDWLRSIGLLDSPAR
jgi:alpha-beta hydrolase superfamily lysophospholipase